MTKAQDQPEQCNNIVVPQQLTGILIIGLSDNLFLQISYFLQPPVQN